MLQTINGFDLLLVLVIIGLAYRAFSLNRECESYVRQIVEMSWDLQKVTKKVKDLEPPF
jgi:cell division protein FtsL